MSKQLIGVRASAKRWSEWQWTEAAHCSGSGWLVLVFSRTRLLVTSRDKTLEIEYRWLDSDEAAMGIRWTDIMRLEVSDVRDEIYSETFYMVYGEVATMPTVRHRAAGAARDEAERLARKHPGQRFFVLQAIAGRVVSETPVTRIVLS